MTQWRDNIILILQMRKLRHKKFNLLRLHCCKQKSYDLNPGNLAVGSVLLLTMSYYLFNKEKKSLTTLYNNGQKTWTGTLLKKIRWLILKYVQFHSFQEIKAF